MGRDPARPPRVPAPPGALRAGSLDHALFPRSWPALCFRPLCLAMLFLEPQTLPSPPHLHLLKFFSCFKAQLQQLLLHEAFSDCSEGVRTLGPQQYVRGPFTQLGAAVPSGPISSLAAPLSPSPPAASQAQNPPAPRPSARNAAPLPPPRPHPAPCFKLTLLGSAHMSLPPCHIHHDRRAF